MEGLWLKTKKPVYHQMARFWTKVFALTFAIGVATGIVMEFEFGTNWATYSRLRRRRVRQRAGGGRHLRVFPRIRLSRRAAVRLGQGRPQIAFFLDLHGLPRRAFQRHLDRRRQFLDADARRLSHRNSERRGTRGNHRLLATGLQSVLDGPLVPHACAARGRPARFSSSASARGIC